MADVKTINGYSIKDETARQEINNLKLKSEWSTIEVYAVFSTISEEYDNIVIENSADIANANEIIVYFGDGIRHKPVHVRRLPDNPLAYSAEFYTTSANWILYYGVKVDFSTGSILGFCSRNDWSTQYNDPSFYVKAKKIFYR